MVTHHDAWFSTLHAPRPARGATITVDAPEPHSMYVSLPRT